jgi:hypothetical protein
VVLAQRRAGAAYCRPGNEQMLFNGLLRYRYPDFTNDMLDDIEKFLLGLKEHPFQIPEKISAIRTTRLMGNRKEAAPAKN